MFDDVGIYRVLTYLLDEGGLYLTEEDHKKLLVYKLGVDTGSGLSQVATQEILRMHKLVRSQQGGLETDPPLTAAKILNDLRGANKMFSPTEAAFVNAVSGKVRQGQRLTTEEMTALLGIYADKGF